MAVATLYRMVLSDHTCPYGVAAEEMLQAAGYEVDDRILKSREEVERFKAENDVETTPLIFIDGEPVGGMAQLEDYLRTAEALPPSPA
jgi:glutaredoxin